MAAGPTNEQALAPMILIAGGAAFGPSLGHFYARRPARALTTALVRSGAVVTSLAVALSACPLEGCTNQEETTAAVSLVAGAGIVTVLAIYDMATARASVRAYNRRISLVPWIRPGGRGAGVLARLRL